VPSTRASRELAVPAQEIWALLDDAHHLPRWWPGVTRVEAVSGDRFTQVMLTKKGRPMRVDFRVIESDPPHVRSWALDPENSPFERVVDHWETTVNLQPDASGQRTTVTIEERQKMRGTLRLAGYMQRRAGRRRLREALDSLSQIYGD
jgi:uncharacterized protein YndB with AHSA1/START domain